MAKHVVGISAFYHDSAAALITDGRLVAAAQEERFTRVKHDPSFPQHALEFCLHHGGVPPDGIDAVVFYEKPMTTFVRLLRTYLKVGPKGFPSFRQAIPLWMREKLWIPYEIERGVTRAGYRPPGDVFFVEHHESHAASAFYPSPFERAAILTFDGVGEWATSSIGEGHANEIQLREQLEFPHSLGLLYSAFTYFCGFRVNSGEYKLMGLAPYGEPRYAGAIRDHLLDIHADGSFALDLSYFDYLSGLTMTSERFADLFGGPPREPESELTKREMDLAASVQQVTEEVVLAMAHHAHRSTGHTAACLAGGVALNCVANGRLLREGPFADVWIQPASGDAGGAVGAAYLGWHRMLDNPRAADGRTDQMGGTYLGPRFDDKEIGSWLEKSGFPSTHVEEVDRWADRIAELVEAGNVIGILQGAMEFGPRALGHRSIIGDPRSARMQSVMNQKIKYRESFRPFAPAVLREHADRWFELDTDSPYMLLVAQVEASRRRATEEPADLRAWVNQVRSEIPAVTHVDGSARVQTVDDRSPGFQAILRSFEALTGCGVLINTSFNVRGEPIVCTPEDAYRCFMRTEMDVLVLERHILMKSEQPAWSETSDWQHDFVLD